MKDLIEKLKDRNYFRAYLLMTPEEQEALSRAGYKNRYVLSNHGWVDDWQRLESERLESERLHLTFAIKPDYQPEPEYADYLIEICEDNKCEEGMFLGVKTKLDNSPILPHEHTYLYCLPSLPNFAYFWYETQATEPRVHFSDVARFRSEGHTVYARFRV